MDSSKPLAVPPLPFTSIRLSHHPTQYRCPRDWTWNTRLPDYDLWIVLGGRGEIRINGEPLEVAAPVAVLMRPGEVLAGTHDPRTPLEVVVLHFTPIGGRANRLSAWARRTRTVRLRPLGAWRELAEFTVAQLNAGDALARQQSEPLAMALMTGLWRLAHTPVARDGDDYVEALIRDIQREPEKLWSLDEMQRGARMGATRLNGRFRQLTGLSPARWVIRCRVERASLLLRDTSMKIADIAEACGYADVYFFARQFRKITGQPPGAWRHARTGN